MKVLHLISSIGLFGAEVVSREIARGISKYGHKVFVGLILDSTGTLNTELVKEFQYGGLNILTFQTHGKLDFKTIVKIRGVLKEEKVEIVHSHNYKSNVYALLARAGLNVKQVVTCHNWIINSFKGHLYALIDKFFLGFSHAIAGVSCDVYHQIIQAGVDPARVTIIHNGVDTGRFYRDTDNTQPTPLTKRENTVICAVGRLTKEKGHELLLKAFSRIASEFPNVILEFVGDGPLRDRLNALSRRLQMGDKVEFMGWRDDIPDILKGIDIFILPSFDEGMPVALMEAMASCKPVIATRVGEIPRLINNMESGVLISPGSDEEIYKSLKMLLTDTAVSENIARKGFEKIRREFSAENMVKQYLLLYQSVLNGKKSCLEDGGTVVMVEIAGKGGICHYTYSLLKALSSIESVMLLTSQYYEFRNERLNFKYAGAFNHLRTNPLVLIGFIKLCRNSSVKLFHFQLSQYPLFVLFLCMLVKLFSNKRIVITAHNVLSHENRGWEKFAYKFIYSMADKIIVHAEANKIDMLKYFLIKESKIDVIPHGNYLLFNRSTQCPYAPESKTVLFFGYIRKYKGLMYLLDAFKSVIEKIPEARLVIAGKPVEEFSVYQNRIEELGLSKNIRLHLGYISVDKIQDYFCESNLLALPYTDIYQSGAVQLAYAFGRPVVATKVGGLAEAVFEGKTGFLVPPGDSRQLAERIIILLQDHELQRKMGEYGFNLAKTAFSWESIAKKTDTLYSQLLS